MRGRKQTKAVAGARKLYVRVVASRPQCPATIVIEPRTDHLPTFTPVAIAKNLGQSRPTAPNEQDPWVYFVLLMRKPSCEIAGRPHLSWRILSSPFQPLLLECLPPPASLFQRSQPSLFCPLDSSHNSVLFGGTTFRDM